MDTSAFKFKVDVLITIIYVYTIFMFCIIYYSRYNFRFNFRPFGGISFLDLLFDSIYF